MTPLTYWIRYLLQCCAACQCVRGLMHFCPGARAHSVCSLCLKPVLKAVQHLPLPTLRYPQVCVIRTEKWRQPRRLRLQECLIASAQWPHPACKKSRSAATATPYSSCMWSGIRLPQVQCGKGVTQCLSGGNAKAGAHWRPNKRCKAWGLNRSLPGSSIRNEWRTCASCLPTAGPLLAQVPLGRLPCCPCSLALTWTAVL